MIISKSTFKVFLQCPKNAWLKLYRPDLSDLFTASGFGIQLREQGNEVEIYARKLFPAGVEITETGAEGQKETAKHIKAKTSAIFQASFLADAFLAKCDVLKYNKTNQNWDLCEVKASNAVQEDGPEEEDHITDLAFQGVVLQLSKIPVGHYSLIHVNKEYVRWGEVDVDALFTLEDVTEKVVARMEEIKSKMDGAKEYLSRKKEPTGPCDCIYSGRNSHCETFDHSNPDMADYGVHDIANIREKKLRLFTERKIHKLEDIPHDFDLTENQWNQVNAHRTKKPIIDVEAIRAELGALRYPLYFFDYEAFGLAVPPHDGYAPYKKIPFQYSLDVLHDQKGKPEHFEFLHIESTDPTESAIANLQNQIKPGGTVIAWSISFERGVNNDMAERVPSAASFFEMVNASLWDLRKIFQNQYYVHPGFEGRTTLKKVLPALTKLGYDSLDIRDGGQAVREWVRMFAPETTPAERTQITANLKKYCGLDSIAMYHIWQHLWSKIEE